MKEMLSPAGPEIENAFYNLIFMALCLKVALTQESYMEAKLDQLQSAIKKFLQIFQQVCWAFPRMLLLLQIVDPKVSWGASHCFGGLGALRTFWWIL